MRLIHWTIWCLYAKKSCIIYYNQHCLCYFFISIRVVWFGFATWGLGLELGLASWGLGLATW